jgi:hypothetical protein
VKGIFDRLRFCELDSHDRENILFAVKRHMLLHDPDRLSLKKKIELVHNPGWEVLKWTAFADEACRGPELFNRDEFFAKISRLEERVANIGANRDDLRKRVKEFVDGNKIQEWVSAAAVDKTLIRGLLEKATDFVIEELNSGRKPSETDIRAAIQ